MISFGVYKILFPADDLISFSINTYVLIVRKYVVVLGGDLGYYFRKNEIGYF